MPKRISRVQKTDDRDEPTTGVKSLLHDLNNTPLPDGSQSDVDHSLLLMFVKGFQNFENVLRTAKSTRPNLRETSHTDELKRAATALNRLFSHYTLTPVLKLTLSGAERRLGWGLWWYQNGRTKPYREFIQVLRIKELADEGRLSSLRQCDSCNQWLFARFSHQRFCSDTCKQTFHRTNPEDKARRREWARKNYWLHKNKNIK